MRILGTIDLTHEVQRVGAWTGALGERLGATVDLLYVAPPRASAEDLADSGRVLEEQMAALPEAVRGQARCEPGKTVDTIIAIAEPYQAVVVGPRDLGAFERLFLGTVAAQVVRRAHCPVFVARADPLPEQPSVLVGLDISRGTHQSLLDRAAEWTVRLSGVLDGVYVDNHRVPYIRDASLRHAAEREVAGARERDRRSIAAMLEAVPEPHRGEAFCEYGGTAGEKLVEMSGTYNMVVVGSLERHGVVEHLLGSVAEYTVARAACNVLTFPSSARRS